MKKINLLLFIITGLFFSACTEDDPAQKDIVVVTPNSYAFERDGASTVSYGGQTTRLKMASAIYTALKTTSFTQPEIDNMFNNGEGFTDTSLNGTGKKLGNKTAAYGSATVKPWFDAQITEAVNIVFQAVNASTDASAGVAGTYTDTGGSQRSVKINAKGHEINQLFTKGLMGALVGDQIIYGYLSKAKLDGGDNISNNDNGVLVDGKNYTNMEHYWDEGFGYLYGMETDISNSSIEGDGIILDKYLSKVDGSSLPGIAQEIYDAFKLGRAAITAGNYTIRDEQAEIIKTKISHVIGRKAADYLRGAATSYSAGNMADAFHSMSEAYGFILSLQFTKNLTTGAPYFSNSEVNNHLATIDDFWAISENAAVSLPAMALEIETRFGF